MKRELNTDELKAILVDMVEWFDAFAQKHNIRYSLHGGSMLGAIRHSGFIPWDDDLDIAMLREDYDRLVQLMKDQNGRYILLAPESNGKYLYTFAKLVDTHTELVEDNLDCGVQLGVYLDIFPYDDDSGDVRIRTRRGKILDKCDSLVSFVLNRGGHHATGIRKVVAWLADVFFAVFGKQYATRHLLKKAKKMACASDNDGHISIYLMSYTKFSMRQFIKKEWFDEIVLHKFERLRLPVLVESHEYLTQLYGDYMTLPPVEQQVSHHEFHAYMIH